MIIGLIQAIPHQAFVWYDEVCGILYSLCLHRRVYSNGALENNIIKLDIINTQAFVLPPRNPACKALTCSHFHGHRHVGGHGSRPAAEAEGLVRNLARNHDLLSQSASGWRYQPVEYTSSIPRGAM